MNDLASLQIEVVTSTGDSEAKLAALSASADSTSASIASVEAAAATAGASFGKITPATNAVAMSMAALASASDPVVASMTATGGAMESMAAAIEATTASLATFDTSMGLSSAAMDALAASAAALVPALGEAEAATAAVTRESVVLPLHMIHLGEAAAAGSVSMRMLGSVMNGFREVLGGIAAAIGISVMALVGLGVGLGILAVEVVKTIKDSEDLDKAITGMAHGIASGMGITTKAFEEETQAATKMADISKSSAEEIGQAYIKTGNVGTDGLGKLIAATETYARLTGTDIKEAGKTLSEAFKDPEKGAQTLRDSIVELTHAQMLEVTQLNASGQADKVADVLKAALIARTDQEAKAAGNVAGAWTSQQTCSIAP